MTTTWNTFATVRLSTKGHALWNQYHHTLGLNAPEIPEDGTLRLELWHLAHIFGPHLYNGCKSPFQGIEIGLDQP